jgi:hypothetical protein
LPSQLSRKKHIGLCPITASNWLITPDAINKSRIFSFYHGFEETESIQNWCSNHAEQIAALPMTTEGRLTVESHLRAPSFLQTELSSVMDQLN